MRKHKLIKYIGAHFLIGSVAIGFFMFLRFYGTPEKPSYFLETQDLMFVVLAGGFAWGISLGLIDYFISSRIMYRKPLSTLIIIGTSLYFVGVIIIYTAIVFAWDLYLDETLFLDNYSRVLFSKGSMVFMIYSFIVVFFIGFFKLLNRKFGPGNLFKVLIGMYYSPKSEDKALMFLDLRDSTTIAEKLGHLTYSMFIQECFRDLSVVADYGAQIYQYVGDEAVLSWDLQKIEETNIIDAFYAFQAKLKERSKEYDDHYGVCPVFKAGINGGTVTVTEVGEIKREIAFHGDTINTASRIQSLCNEFGKELLVSEEIKKRFVLKDRYREEFIGAMKLKGKNEEIKVYAIEKNS